MIGYISGKVIFSDGHETVLSTLSGVGYQIYYSKILPEGYATGLYISHVIRETTQDLYGFHDLRSKKLFELLMTVKGIGPKGAYNLVSRLTANEIISAVQTDNKKLITSAPGVGMKAASQIILDLQGKIQKVLMYSDRNFEIIKLSDENSLQPSFDDILLPDNQTSDSKLTNHNQILDETIMACKELGFKEDHIIKVATKILSSVEIVKAEQLVHLVLKEI